MHSARTLHVHRMRAAHILAGDAGGVPRVQVRAARSGERCAGAARTPLSHRPRTALAPPSHRPRTALAPPSVLPFKPNSTPPSAPPSAPFLPPPSAQPPRLPRIARPTPSFYWTWATVPTSTSTGRAATVVVVAMAVAASAVAAVVAAAVAAVAVAAAAAAAAEATVRMARRRCMTNSRTRPRCACPSSPHRAGAGSAGLFRLLSRASGPIRGRRRCATRPWVEVTNGAGHRRWRGA